MDGNATLSFREFLVSMAIGYYLTHQSEDANFRKIQKGFRVVQKAFNDMDVDKGGSIDAKELKAALFATASGSDTELLEKRFTELDFDGDGDILLPEFMYGMVSWVGFADDIDEEETAETEAA
jgi:Ca2+-binding EF-hand superfamily protein